MDSTAPCPQTWGAQSITLVLPAICVHFTGLSPIQITSIHRDYAGFVADPTRSTEAHDTECQGYRLTYVPQGDFGKYYKGEYLFNPESSNHGSHITLTCSDFIATIPLNDQAFGSIGVIEEKTLVEGRAIENFLRTRLAHSVLEQKGLMLHSAGLVYDGKAYIFTGRSNAGKTTLTRKAFENGACVLSDDINLITPAENGGYQAHAVPFTGEFGRTLDHEGSRDAYPLAGIILLEQSDFLKTEAVRGSQAFATVLAGCPFVNTDAEEATTLYDAIDNVLANTPVIRLHSRRDDPVEDIMTAVKDQFTRGEKNSPPFPQPPVIPAQAGTHSPANQGHSIIHKHSERQT